MRDLRPKLLIAAAMLALVAAAFALQTAVQRHRAAAGAPASMAQMLPPGALLTIGSPDFSGVLKAWTGSSESSSWLASADYSVFQNSRLFSRLSDAQAEFASTAGLASAGTGFLESVAGGESIFAWYDVGDLQFLYITRMTPARAAQTKLMQARAHFERRQAGTSVFYAKTKAGSGGASQDRTVAFAVTGNLLVLATREDLMANALSLIDRQGGDSLAREPWYSEAETAQQPASGLRPDLHMVLNLDRIVPMPYFRSYWVQGDGSEMKEYRSAVADLYRETTRFREERTLLPKTAAEQGSDPDLAPLQAMVPDGAGLFRVKATSDPAAAVKALEERLFGQEKIAASTSVTAPEADLTRASAGNAEDLETRIDTPAPVAAGASTEALRQGLRAAGLNAVMTVDSTVNPAAVWLPIHSAVVLRTDRPVDAATFTDAVQQALRGALTASSLGIEFTLGSGGVLALDGPKRLFLSVQSNVCFLSDDAAMLRAMLGLIPSSGHAAPESAAYLAGFDHAAERPAYLRLTGLLEGSAEESAPATPAFFSGNVRSLSDTFAALKSERMSTRHEAGKIRQTVIYQWGAS